MVRAIAQALGQRGIQVDVFTRENAPENVGQIVKMAKNTRLIYLPAGPPQHLDPDQIYPYVSQFVKAMLTFAEENGLRYDLLYSHYWISGAVALQLREMWQIPIVQMFHTLGQMKQRIANVRNDESPASLIPAEPNPRVKIESEVMNVAERLIAATHAERVQMLMLYRAKRRRIEVVPPGVDLKRFYSIDQDDAKEAIGIKPEQRMLLFVGRIEPLKGIDIICRAVALLRQAAPSLVEGLKLVVVGGDSSNDSADSSEMKMLRELCESLRIQDLIRFDGAKEQDDVFLYYNAAEALILPSDYESFGMVALEAMACGTPVIASEVGGLAFLIKDGVNGFHVPTREPVALAERMYTILCDHIKRNEMGKAAQLMAKDYSWNRIADRLMEIFIDATLENSPQYTVH